MISDSKWRAKYAACGTTAIEEIGKSTGKRILSIHNSFHEFKSSDPADLAIGSRFEAQSAERLLRNSMLRHRPKEMPRTQTRPPARKSTPSKSRSLMEHILHFFEQLGSGKGLGKNLKSFQCHPILKAFIIDES